MRILGIGASCDLGDLYLRLQGEGHTVRVWSAEHAESRVMEGMLDHVDSWRAQLGWVRDAGNDGVIVFETAEHGAEQDALRREGFAVIGGSALGDRPENERAFGQAMLASCGLHRIERRLLRKPRKQRITLAGPRLRQLLEPGHELLRLAWGLGCQGLDAGAFVLDETVFE